jgi:cytochrome c biogenesis protein ResB
MDRQNRPAVVMEIVDASGKALGTWLFSLVLNEQEFEVGGKTYRGVLRPTRYYEHFSLKLLKTTHEVYRGTEIPRNFQSRVLLENPRTNEKREVDIYMNNPLRYAGLTFFQHQMGRDEIDVNRGTSVFQVVKNPSWLTPYLGTIVVGLGLTVQFMIHLVGFIRKRA